MSYDVLVVAGQSNAIGCGRPVPAQPDPANAGLFQLAQTGPQSGQVVPLTEPLLGPGASGWREVTTAGGDDGPPASPPEWVQPTGAHDAYALGDQVTYDGKVWKSATANNVWAPGVYGWEVVE